MNSQTHTDVFRAPWRVVLFGLLLACLRSEVLDAVQTRSSQRLGWRKTSLIIDLVYCGERGAAAAALQADSFLMLMALIDLLSVGRLILTEQIYQNEVNFVLMHTVYASKRQF